MNLDRRPSFAVWLALCFHVPLVLGGFYRESYDVGTHLFLADHYRQSWFSLWDPRWFGGFSVSSYPPLVHQLIALLGIPLGYDGAFAAVLLSAAVAFPIAVHRFALVFVSSAAAGAAALASVFLPAFALTGDTFGQLPTLVALVLALFLACEWTRYVEDGGRLRLALVGALAAVTFAAHHATPLLFLPPILLVCVLRAARGREPRAAIGRAAVAAGVCALVGAVVLLPFWLWAAGASRQATIAHLSRLSYLASFDAQALFFWAVYGVIPALALFALFRAVFRNAVSAGRPSLRDGPPGPVVLAAVFGVIGLGGTTPLPALLFGERWEWLTYDRFALWSAVALLPLAGVTLDALLVSPRRLARWSAGLALAILAAFSIVDAALLRPAVPEGRDLQAVADFLNASDRASWRYQTFGFGDGSSRLGTLTRAATIDGAYFSARRLAVLAESGIGMLDSALWSDPSGMALRRVLASADQLSIRWAFVLEGRYDPYLAESGFRPASRLGAIEVWDRPGTPRLPDGAVRFGEPDAAGILWGTLPLAALAAAAALALARRRVAITEPGGRTIGRWKLPRSVAGRPSLSGRA